MQAIQDIRKLQRVSLAIRKNVIPNLATITKYLSEMAIFVKYFEEFNCNQISNFNFILIQ